MNFSDSHSGTLPQKCEGPFSTDPLASLQPGQEAGAESQ